MTPKEKAIQIVNTYKVANYPKLDIDECKKCALIAVDEILDTLKRNSTEFNGCMDFQLIAWWKEVKIEIEKL